MNEIYGRPSSVSQIPDLQIGDLVRITDPCPAIPDEWPDNITFHEGNAPWLMAGDVGMVLDVMDRYGTRRSSYPMALLLVGDRRFGVNVKNLEIVQRSHQPRRVYGIRWK